MTDIDRAIEGLKCMAVDMTGAMVSASDYPEAIKSLKEDIAAIDLAIQALQEKQERRWIPVSERLPDIAGEYLVLYHPCHWDNVRAETCVGIDTFRGKVAWAKKKHQRVTAWQPLPEPWKGE